MKKIRLVIGGMIICLVTMVTTFNIAKNGDVNIDIKKDTSGVLKTSNGAGYFNGVSRGLIMVSNTIYADSSKLAMWDSLNNCSITTKVFNSSGLITSQSKSWVGIVTPNTTSGYVVDISSASFSVITNVQLTASNNTSTITSMPMAIEKSHTLSSLTINILGSNSTLVGILGLTVVGLTTSISLTGVTVNIRVDGY